MKAVQVERACCMCDTVFVTAYSQKKVCSKTCELSFRRQSRTGVYKICVVCPKQFKAIGNTTTCSEECNKKRLDIRKKKLQKQTIKTCVVCDGDFIAIGNAMTCSKHCSKIKVNLRVNNRYHADLNFKLADILRSRLGSAIDNNQKVGSAIDDLGCSIDKLRIHLQLKFHRNPRGKHEYMTWDNHSFRGWHIDHIKSLASFDLSDPEQLKIACHYTNLQPLWWRENIKKR